MASQNQFGIAGNMLSRKRDSNFLGEENKNYYEIKERERE
jgi:hypothetical protein